MFFVFVFCQCLVCKKDLPTTVAEIKEGIEAVKKASKGDWSGVAQKTVDETVGNQVSNLKYRFSPAWIVKVKIHKLKRSLKSLLWVLAIIIGLVIFYFITKLLGKIF